MSSNLTSSAIFYRGQQLSAPNSNYELLDTATAFAAMAADPLGEKALIWRILQPHLATLSKQARFLDFGCGTGWLARRVQYDLKVEALGYDPAPQMIAQAKLAAAADAVTFTTQLADVPASTFDFVALIFVTPAIATFDELRQAFVDAAARARSGATVAVFVANPSAVLLRHVSYQSRALDGGLQAGMPYAVDLYHSDGRLLVTVTDTFWPHEKLVEASRAAGLESIISQPVADAATAADAADEVHPYRLYLFKKN